MSSTRASIGRRRGELRFVGQRSAGVGWRKGDVSTSIGWVHEKNTVKGVCGAPSEKDDRVALNLSWRPSPR